MAWIRARWVPHGVMGAKPASRDGTGMSLAHDQNASSVGNEKSLALAISSVLYTYGRAKSNAERALSETGTKPRRYESLSYTAAAGWVASHCALGARSCFRTHCTDRDTDGRVAAGTHAYSTGNRIASSFYGRSPQA